MAFIRSISGLRATPGDDLPPSVVANYVAAFAATRPPGSIAVGRDGRPSGEWIEQIVCGTLAACGRDVRRLGVVPTPTVQVIAAQDTCAGGISITASHNPAEWNGLKFLDAGGLFLDAAALARVWNALDSHAFQFADSLGAGTIITELDAVDTHVRSIVDHPVFRANNGRNLNSIRGQQWHVVVDAVNAGGSTAIPALLETFGARVTALHCDGSGIFPHTPEPLPQHLGSLCEAVRQHQADFGIAVDPDADRLVLVDEHGNPVSEEKTVVLACKAVLEHKEYFADGRNAEIKLAVNLSTTRAVEDIANQYGAQVLRTPVGEINVVNTMIAAGAIAGGEGSGGVIVPQFHAGRDSLVGCALLLLLLGTAGRPFSALLQGIPDYAMIKRKKPFAGETNALFDSLQAAHPQAEAVRGDGLKLLFDSSWVHIRTSNTEPVVRIIAEAPSRVAAEKLAEQFAASIG